MIVNQHNYGKNIDVQDNSYNNNNLKVSLYVQGLSFPTSMAFVDNNTIMVLEKNTGYVRLVSHGKLQKEPILKVSNIDNKTERGLLGIAILKEDADNNSKYSGNFQNIFSNIHKVDYKYAKTLPLKFNSNYSIFLYFTEKTKNTDNDNNSSFNDNIYNDNQVIRNRIYKYSWDGNYSHKLDKPILLMDLPATLGPYHNGGKLKIGPDNNLYGVIGDLATINNTLQNRPDGSQDNFSNTIPNNSSVIVRISAKNGSYLEDNPFFKYYNNNSISKSLKYYYAYGIRNSFGIAFDPITGDLWDTENGEDKYDEINIVKPGFNSGWHQVMGPLLRNNGSSESNLIMFKGSHYSDPVFSWTIPIGITDVEFFNSSKLGQKYNNNIFVGDINNGNLYFFKVNASRTGLELDMPIKGVEKETLGDKVADNKTEPEVVLFAKGFEGKITDIETGPDGYLYILTYFDGKIYKISP
jgi:glucose/arabinose dehydrogenase